MPALIASILGMLAGPAAAAQTFPQFVDVADAVGVTLRNVSGDREKNYIVESAGNGVAFFDYDNDGDTDLLLTNGSTLDTYPGGGNAVAALYRNEDGIFDDRTHDAGLTATGWGMGVCVADYDNDGDRDIYITAYGPNLLYRNNGDSTFIEISGAAGVADAQWATNCAFGDYDRDGRVDIFLINWFLDDRCHLLHNVSPKNHWLNVQVVGKQMNRMGIGAQVKIYESGQLGKPAALLGFQEITTGYGYASGQEAICHFGLGKADQVDVLVKLPSGKLIKQPGVQADQRLVIEEPE